MRRGTRTAAVVAFSSALALVSAQVSARDSTWQSVYDGFALSVMAGAAPPSTPGTALATQNTPRESTGATSASSAPGAAHLTDGAANDASRFGAATPPNSVPQLMRVAGAGGANVEILMGNPGVVRLHAVRTATTQQLQRSLALSRRRCRVCSYQPHFTGEARR